MCPERKRVAEAALGRRVPPGVRPRSRRRAALQPAAALYHGGLAGRLHHAAGAAAALCDPGACFSCWDTTATPGSTPTPPGSKSPSIRSRRWVWGSLLSGIVLLLIGRLTAEQGLDEIVGRIVVEAVTVAIGVSVGTAQLGGETGRAGPAWRTREERSFGGQLTLAVCGAVLFAANVAPTEEVVLIGIEMSGLRLAAVCLATMVVGALILYYSDFRGSRRWVRAEGPLSVVQGTVSPTPSRWPPRRASSGCSADSTVSAPRRSWDRPSRSASPPPSAPRRAGSFSKETPMDRPVKNGLEWTVFALCAGAGPGDDGVPGARVAGRGIGPPRRRRSRLGTPVRLESGHLVPVEVVNGGRTTAEDVRVPIYLDMPDGDGRRPSWASTTCRPSRAGTGG